MEHSISLLSFSLLLSQQSGRVEAQHLLINGCTTTPSVVFFWLHFRVLHANFLISTSTLRPHRPFFNYLPADLAVGPFNSLYSLLVTCTCLWLIIYRCPFQGASVNLFTTLKSGVSIRAFSLNDIITLSVSPNSLLEWGMELLKYPWHVGGEWGAAWTTWRAREKGRTSCEETSEWRGILDIWF